MSSALVSGITDVFRSQVAAPFASNAGESESSVVRGFETGLGAMVESLAARVRQSGFASQLFDLINSPANDLRVLENPRSLVGSPPNVASKFTSMLFGSKFSALTDEIGSASGIRGRTAASLMTLGAPLLLGTLKKRIGDGRMDSSRLNGFLATEADSLRGSLPERVENFIVSETLVAGTVPPVASAVVRQVPGTVPPVASAVVQQVPETVPPVASTVVEGRSRSWLWPLLLGFVLLGGLLWWWLGSNKTTVETTTTAAPAAIKEVKDMVTRRLPSNVDLQFPANEIEDRLLGFIQDPSRPVDKTTWFDFDRLLFDTNSATLQPGSSEELANIGAILKAYPNVHVKIGAYTDSTGDADANMRLSQRRADTVRQQLIGMGISPDRLEAEGYGEQHPVANNATEAGRQQNRHVSLLVTQK
jgi:outer membrane protein OmpA-like peptidoglycan-associated protein